MPCAVFVPRCNPSRVFLQPASQIAKESSSVWFYKVFFLSCGSVCLPSNLLSKGSRLFLPYLPVSGTEICTSHSSQAVQSVLNSLGTSSPKSKPPVSHLVGMETCWFRLEWSYSGSNCLFYRVSTNPALLSFNYTPFGMPFMASSSRVFTEFQDGNWRAPCLSTQHLMGILFQFSLIWKLNFTLSICFLASKVLLISLHFFLSFPGFCLEFLLRYRSRCTRVSGNWFRTEGGIWSWLPSFYKNLTVVTFCFPCSEASVHLSALVAPKTFFPCTVCSWYLCCLLDAEERKV